LSADEFTTNYMKERPNVFRQCDPNFVFNKLREYSGNYSSMDLFVKDLITKLDAGRKGFIDFEEMVAGLEALKISLSYSEAFTLLRQYDTNGDLKLNVKEFFESLKRFINSGGC